MAAQSETSPSRLAAQLPTEKELQHAIRQRQEEIALLRKILAKRRQVVDPRQIGMFE